MGETIEETLVFESGKVLLSTGNFEVLEINLASNKINVDVKNKAFIKRAIKLRGEIIPNTPTSAEQKQGVNTKKKSSSPLSILKIVAEALTARGITLTVSYKGSIVVTIGADAKPTLLQLITKTKSVSINSFYKIIRMII